MISLILKKSLTESNQLKALRIINVNFKTLASKKGTWINLLHSTRPDVLIANEIWLGDTIRNSELESDSYTICSRGRILTYTEVS